MKKEVSSKSNAKGSLSSAKKALKKQQQNTSQFDARPSDPGTMHHVLTTNPLPQVTCNWPSNDPLMIVYHDTEWGVPLHDDRKLFEYMVLDAFQAGLSWKTVLHKRENFRKAFDNFEPKVIASYTEEKILELLSNPGIIRNRAKVRATVENAKAFLKVQKEFGTFDRYIWQFTGGKTLVNRLESLSQMPVSSSESDTMSKDLIKRGFKFVGTTICYAFMQAAGMVNDHLVGCFRYEEL